MPGKCGCNPGSPTRASKVTVWVDSLQSRCLQNPRQGNLYF